MIIAITCDRRSNGPANPSSNLRPSRPEIFLSQHLVDRVRKAGAVPILLPPGGGAELVDWVIDSCDAVIISGGAFDIDPNHYGQTINARVDHIDEGRTGFELLLARRCMDENKPVLGICGGMQVLAVAAGGSLIQDIGTQIPQSLEHEQPTDPALTWHSVHLSSQRLISCYGTDEITVNSTHHQAVKSLGTFASAGRASDGVVEAIEHPDLDFCIGVQWHPELIRINVFTLLVEHSLR
jgi:putative glutamine amidotransferase